MCLCLVQLCLYYASVLLLVPGGQVYGGLREGISFCRVGRMPENSADTLLAVGGCLRTVTSDSTGVQACRLRTIHWLIHLLWVPDTSLNFCFVSEFSRTFFFCLSGFQGKCFLPPRGKPLESFWSKIFWSCCYKQKCPPVI